MLIRRSTAALLFSSRSPSYQTLWPKVRNDGRRVPGVASSALITLSLPRGLSEDAGRYAMGRENSRALSGGHWGGRPPERNSEIPFPVDHANPRMIGSSDDAPRGTARTGGFLSWGGPPVVIRPADSLTPLPALRSSSPSAGRLVSRETTP